MVDIQQDLIYINEVLNSSEISSLLSHPPYPLTLTVEELTKAPTMKNCKSKYDDTSNDKIPRPSNPFMIYRKNYAAKMKSMSLAAHTTKTSVKVAKIWAQETKSKQKGLKFREFCLKKTINKDNSKKSLDLTVITSTTITRSITVNKQQSFDNLSNAQQETLPSPESKTFSIPHSSKLSNYGLSKIDVPLSLFSYSWTY
ncbi:1723_t:CDS:2 [Gigaspora rosea]|nr:1723_t:CDS:2 [Gigaspora rosea]